MFISGCFSWSAIAGWWGRDVIDFHKEYWKPIVTTIIAVVVAVVAPWALGLALTSLNGMIIGGMASGFASGFVGTLLNGGSFRQAMFNGVVGAAKGELFGALGYGVLHAAQPVIDSVVKMKQLAEAMAHGVKAGVVDLANRGKGAAGFLSGLVSPYVGNDVILAALAGGTIAVLGGGKFACGAISGAAGSAVLGALTGEFTIKRSLDIAGKLWASPLTALGIALAVPNFAAGVVLGTHPSVILGHNAMQFTGFPIGGKWAKAITFGNVIQYFDENMPQDLGRRYDGNPWVVVQLGRHEEAHTYQYQRLGIFFPVAYFSQGGFDNPYNPYEFTADNYAQFGGNTWWWTMKESAVRGYYDFIFDQNN